MHRTERSKIAGAKHGKIKISIYCILFTVILTSLFQIIEEEMAPKLEKIREERKAYMEFQLLERELQHLTKIFQAWQYVTSQRHTKNAESALEQGEAELQEMKDNIVKNQEQATQLDAEMAEMIKAADAVSSSIS